MGYKFLGISSFYQSFEHSVVILREIECDDIKPLDDVYKYRLLEQVNYQYYPKQKWNTFAKILWRTFQF